MKNSYRAASICSHFKIVIQSESYINNVSSTAAAAATSSCFWWCPFLLCEAMLSWAKVSIFVANLLLQGYSDNLARGRGRFDAFHCFTDSSVACQLGFLST